MMSDEMGAIKELVLLVAAQEKHIALLYERLTRLEKIALSTNEEMCNNYDLYDR